MNDKYVFETESSREMEIVASRHKILSVLDDIKNWRRELYKGCLLYTSPSPRD